MKTIDDTIKQFVVWVGRGHGEYDLSLVEFNELKIFLDHKQVSYHAPIDSIARMLSHSASLNCNADQLAVKIESQGAGPVDVNNMKFAGIKPPQSLTSSEREIKKQMIDQMGINTLSKSRHNIGTSPLLGEELPERNDSPNISVPVGTFTKRDKIAIKAMQTFIKNTGLRCADIAKCSYNVADAMIELSNTTQQNS
jgi:hypothetical protein